MPLYDVTISARVEKTIRVEADDQEDAIMLAQGEFGVSDLVDSDYNEDRVESCDLVDDEGGKTRDKEFEAEIETMDEAILI
ncbi:MAG TPA: hypothetical protein PK745_17550 [bacterium]|nr:hypothetical protein [bacterium]